MGTDEMANSARPARRRARLFALVALASIAAGVSYAGQQTYHAATDSFVAPIILSPDSDVVLAAKLRASQLSVERSRTASEVDAIDEALEAGRNAIARLKGLQRTPASSHAWTSDTNARQVSAAAAEGKMLMEQRAVLSEMAVKEERLVAEARANLEAGLISKTEYTKELQTQNELQLSLLENERAHHRVQVQVRQITSAQQSLAGTAPPMPEVIAREEQMARIELEVLRLESEHRAKQFEKKLLVEKLVMLDELDAQMKTRPMFRAAERSMDVAFVPYTQMAGVNPGAMVQECIWGAFYCKPVGEVAELVPGEVVLPDPWGNQARGQYAVLKLNNRESAKAKTLRVRPGSPPTRTSAEPSDRISSK
jgi:hypothetical protein